MVYYTGLLDFANFVSGFERLKTKAGLFVSILYGMVLHINH
jgi:hypothetical protein